jgi:anti-sigma regulatory factor (Ser/Thr protein kinase)
VARTLGQHHPCVDAAVLLCSELVTNAVLHSDSGQPGGTVTVVVLSLAGAVGVEVIDNGVSHQRPGREVGGVPAGRARAVPG